MNKLVIGIITAIILISIYTGVSMFKQNDDEYEYGDLTFNISKLNEARYKIEIDCGFINDKLNDTTVFFDEEVITLCQRYFPNATLKDVIVGLDELEDNNGD